MAADPVDVLVIGGGMWFYALLAAFRKVKRPGWLGPREAGGVERGLRDRELQGAALYYDAQTDDARLALATMRGAAQSGALIASYAEATALLKPDGRIGGAMGRGELCGPAMHARARVVVLTAGPSGGAPPCV